MSDEPAQSVPGTAANVSAEAGVGDVVVKLSPRAYAAAQHIADMKGVDVGQAVADALALQETVAAEKSTGARMLIERHGDVVELAG
jgi:hypothetical protein